MNSDTLREYARKLDLNVDVCSRDPITLSDTPMIVNTKTINDLSSRSIADNKSYFLNFFLE